MEYYKSNLPLASLCFLRPLCLAFSSSSLYSFLRGGDSLPPRPLPGLNFVFSEGSSTRHLYNYDFTLITDFEYNQRKGGELMLDLHRNNTV